MSRKSNRRIAIIGGGLSGLATAVKIHLNDASLDLTLFEAADRVGGVIHTECVDGFVIDHGADMFAIKPSAALELCQQLGLEDRLIEPQQQGRGARIVLRGRLVPIPEGFVLMRATQWLPMLTTPLLSIAGKLRFMAERWVKPKSSDADESVADFARRRMGEEVLNRIVAPLAAGIYTADISKLSMQATMRQIAEMERKYGSLAKATSARRRSGEDAVQRESSGARYGQFRALAGGMIELIDSLAAALPGNTVRLTTPVQSIEPVADEWVVMTADDSTHTFDHIVVAVPPGRASKLLHDVAPKAATQLAAIESASTAIVVLGVCRSDIRCEIDMFGFVVPISENRRILAGSFASQKFAGRAPDDQVLIRTFIGGAMQSELLALSDDQLVQIAREELGELIGLGGTPTITRVVRWNQAMPQYHVGHGQRVKEIERSIGEVPGLSLVTNALHGVGIAPVVELAEGVAKQVAASFTRSGDTTSGDGFQS